MTGRVTCPRAFGVALLGQLPVLPSPEPDHPTPAVSSGTGTVFIAVRAILMAPPVPAQKVTGICPFVLVGNMGVLGKLIWLVERALPTIVSPIEQTPEGSWEQGWGESLRTSVL